MNEAAVVGEQMETAEGGKVAGLSRWRMGGVSVKQGNNPK